jgi:hypothetical protein
MSRPARVGRIATITRKVSRIFGKGEGRHRDTRASLQGPGSSRIKRNVPSPDNGVWPRRDDASHSSFSEHTTGFRTMADAPRRVQVACHRPRDAASLHVEQPWLCGPRRGHSRRVDRGLAHGSRSAATRICRWPVSCKPNVKLQWPLLTDGATGCQHHPHQARPSSRY